MFALGYSFRLLLNHMGAGCIFLNLLHLFQCVLLHATTWLGGNKGANQTNNKVPCKMADSGWEQNLLDSWALRV